MKKKRGWWGRLFFCHIMGFHDWTTDFVERGGPPDLKGKTNADIMLAFKNDNMMYCRHCKKDSEVSTQFMKNWK